MTDDRVPVLWITGPAGVGKSTVAWQVFAELAQAGNRVAFADTDQFCICYPAPPGDPGRERIKARNVGALVPRYRAAGARCVIANGVLDPLAGLYSGLMPEADVTVCRLRADRDEITRRFTGRHGPGDRTDEVLRETLAEADAMDASDFADVCIDTSGVTAVEVTGLVRNGLADWPGFNGSLLQDPVPPRAIPGSNDECQGNVTADRTGGRILLICGPTGVGKSTIGFPLFLRYLRDGLAVAYIDLDQIGLIRAGSDTDPGNHLLKAGNLAAMWRTYHAAGARHLIATGPIESEAVLQAYVRALPGASVAVCRVHAEHSELARRIMSRGEGGSWPQPGDPLRGKPGAYLGRVADQATADASALDRAGFGTFRIDTTGLTVAEAVESIAAETKW